MRWLYVEEYKQIIFITLNKIQLQVDQRPQYRTRYTESDKRERQDRLKFLGIEKGILNRTLTAQPPRTTINK